MLGEISMDTKKELEAGVKEEAEKRGQQGQPQQQQGPAAGKGTHRGGVR